MGRKIAKCEGGGGGGVRRRKKKGAPLLALRGGKESVSREVRRRELRTGGERDIITGSDGDNALSFFGRKNPVAVRGEGGGPFR